ncbi:hypothetical protein Tco_0905215, partial [Tanacetum coccineum]
TIMLDFEDSTVTYTEVSSLFEGLSDIRSPGVVGPEYEGLPWMLDDPYVQVILQAPPSPDYVPGPEEPEQAPPLPDLVLEPVYPEFIPPEDEVFPAKEQPLPAAASPTADLPRYVPESDSEEDPEEDPSVRASLSISIIEANNLLQGEGLEKHKERASFIDSIKLRLKSPPKLVPSCFEILICAIVIVFIVFASCGSCVLCQHATTFDFLESFKIRSLRTTGRMFYVASTAAMSLFLHALRSSTVVAFPAFSARSRSGDEPPFTILSGQDVHSASYARPNGDFRRGLWFHLLLDDDDPRGDPERDVGLLDITTLGGCDAYGGYVKGTATDETEFRLVEGDRNFVTMDVREAWGWLWHASDLHVLRRQTQLTKALKLIKILQTQLIALQSRHGPTRGPAQPDTPEEAGSSS